MVSERIRPQRQGPADAAPVHATGPIVDSKARRACDGPRRFRACARRRSGTTGRLAPVGPTGAGRSRFARHSACWLALSHEAPFKSSPMIRRSRQFAILIDSRSTDQKMLLTTEGTEHTEGKHGKNKKGFGWIELFQTFLVPLSLIFRVRIFSVWSLVPSVVQNLQFLSYWSHPRYQ